MTSFLISTDYSCLPSLNSCASSMTQNGLYTNSRCLKHCQLCTRKVRFDTSCLMIYYKHGHVDSHCMTQCPMNILMFLIAIMLIFVHNYKFTEASSIECASNSQAPFTKQHENVKSGPHFSPLQPYGLEPSTMMTCKVFLRHAPGLQFTYLLRLRGALKGRYRRLFTTGTGDMSCSTILTGPPTTKLAWRERI